MLFLSNLNETARQKIKSMFDALSITNLKMGELLHGTSSDYRATQARARNFFIGKRDITIAELEKVADFLGKPVSYFLGMEGNSGVQAFNQGDGNVASVTIGGQEKPKTAKDVMPLIFSLPQGEQEKVKNTLDALFS